MVTFCCFRATLGTFKKWIEKWEGGMASYWPADLLWFTPEIGVNYTRNLRRFKACVDFSFRRVDSQKRCVLLNTFAMFYSDSKFKMGIWNARFNIFCPYGSTLLSALLPLMVPNKSLIILFCSLNTVISWWSISPCWEVDCVWWKISL